MRHTFFSRIEGSISVLCFDVLVEHQSENALTGQFLANYSRKNPALTFFSAWSAKTPVTAVLEHPH
jgi:hypothetical protein